MTPLDQLSATYMYMFMKQILLLLYHKNCILCLFPSIDSLMVVTISWRKLSQVISLSSKPGGQTAVVTYSSGNLHVTSTFPWARLPCVLLQRSVDMYHVIHHVTIM